jgi:glycine/D-amino acid oxidase-like deaminating enzyme
MKKETYDIIIAGGGIMGCAAAYYLGGADNRLDIAVVEKDPTYARASTTLSVGNVRVQFSLEENIKISQYAAQVFNQFKQTMSVDDSQPEIDFRRQGNLFLASQEQRHAAQNALALQKKLGCRVEWWTKEKITQRFPFYQALEMDLPGGIFSPGDGHVDAYSLLMAYKKKARSLGVTFITGEAAKITTQPGRATGITLTGGSALSAPIIINCAGAWAAQLARTAGINLPIKPVKRQVFVLDTAFKPPQPLPLTVLPSGLYFRTDTGNVILLGKSMADDPEGIDFTVDESKFTSRLWPELAGFVPQFDRLKPIRSWAGLYAENTFDSNAILGQWPECKGLYLANGFSGHGLQQAPAVGRYLSELILDRRPTLDLSRFSPLRILENKPLTETGLV